MDDAISRRAAIDLLKKWSDGYSYIEVETNSAIKAFEEIPSADAVPAKHGRWIERESGTEDKEYGFETVIVCSRCDFPATTFYSEDCESRTQIRTDFCPNCGAKMARRKEND
jgi:ribosomal protein S27AE